MTTERNGVRILLWLAGMVMFLLGVFGAGYATLDARKADRTTVEQMAADIREIRNWLMPPGSR